MAETVVKDGKVVVPVPDGMIEEVRTGTGATVEGMKSVAGSTPASHPVLHTVHVPNPALAAVTPPPESPPVAAPPEPAKPASKFSIPSPKKK